jgi:hypothetical protein
LRECSFRNCDNTFDTGPNTKKYCTERCRDNAAKDRKVQLCTALLREAKNVPCTDCGNSYPHYVMDLDHVRGDKVDDPSALAYKGNLVRVAEEIEKCEPVCANCHRERTHSRNQYTA